MILLLSILFFILLYFYVTRNFNYWSKRNVKHDPPIPFFGNYYPTFSGKQSLVETVTDLYNKYRTEKVVGYYKWNSPALIIRDPEIVKHILNTDFTHFHYRGLGRQPKVEPLVALTLFHADGDMWKLMRKRLTPAFTSAKLKSMFPLVVRCAEKLQTVAEDIAAQGGEIDIRDMMARFTTEFIGACGFGIEMDTINNENSLFMVLARRLFHPGVITFLKLTLWEVFPILRNHIYVLDHDIEDIMVEIVKKVMEQRNMKPSGRNDFIDLLLELQEKGKIKGESVEKVNPDGTPMEVEMELDFMNIVAQVFVFFAAGFETSSSSTSYLLHQLAYNPDVLVKIQEEIDEILAKYNNKLSFDAIAEMSLLDMAFKEAMRLLPPLGNLHRVCVKTYTIPNLNITIDSGVQIIIPIQALQKDDKYFENPEKFCPERFIAQQQKSHEPYSYLPFGDGPRMCIGARLGQMQSLAGLAAVLHRFSVEPSSSSTRELKLNPRCHLVQSVIGGLPLKLTARKKKTT